MMKAIICILIILITTSCYDNTFSGNDIKKISASSKILIQKIEDYHKDNSSYPNNLYELPGYPKDVEAPPVGTQWFYQQVSEGGYELWVKNNSKTSYPKVWYNSKTQKWGTDQ